MNTYYQYMFFLIVNYKYISTYGTRAIYLESGVWYCFSDWYPSIFQLHLFITSPKLSEVKFMGELMLENPSRYAGYAFAGTLITQVKPTVKQVQRIGGDRSTPKKKVTNPGDD